MLLAALAVACLASACQLAEVAVPRTTPSVVVHLVLNPAATTQIMYLERTLTGAVTIPDTNVGTNNPIANSGGIPVTGAIAEIRDSTGRVVRGVEDKLTGSGQGTGVYRFAFGTPPRQGWQYDLLVRTADDAELTASTRVPRPTSSTPGVLTRTFNRDHDALLVQWARAAETRTYSMRVETPYGPFFLFTDTTAVRLNGETRNPFAPELERLFIPGFRQDVLIAAVDSNYYDYYRTNNDPFTGSGIISRINGGLGLFGAIATITSGTLTVIADTTEAIEGRFRLTPASTDLTAPSTITLYIESKSTRAGVPDVISGRWSNSSPTPKSDGIIGERLGSHVTLTFLNNQLADQTLDVFTGELDGKTITGTYRKRSGVAVFSK